MIVIQLINAITEMLELCSFIDLVLSDGEYNYICSQIDCEDGYVRIGAFMLFLGSLL